MKSSHLSIISRVVLPVQVLLYFLYARASLGQFANERQTAFKVRTGVKNQSFWAVTTTILEVNPAVVHVADKLRANLVVVGDMKTNDTEWFEFEKTRDNVVYLSPNLQGLLNLKISREIPWNHFGRKTIGFYLRCNKGHKQFMILLTITI